MGLFLVNYYLYNMCVRNWKVPLHYRITDMDSYNVCWSNIQPMRPSNRP